jgi:hypothetical protein
VFFPWFNKKYLNWYLNLILVCRMSSFPPPAWETRFLEDMAILGEDPEKLEKGALEDWVGNPMENWELPELLLKEVKDRLQLK